jgi:peptidoglycan hydrolase-like protein with peptidoglycan-binding domain
VGDAVKEIQQALKIQVDGFFGAKTEEAVKEFQTAQSLEADGIVGPRTRAKLIPDKKDEEHKEVPVPACGRRGMASWWLARGAVGNSVKEIQQTLGIPVDGFFGPRTEQAVKAFQIAHSLDADGVVGPQTRAQLTRVQTASTEKKEVPVEAAPVPQESAPAVQASAPVAQVPELSPAMAQLVNMGFPDLELNASLLRKHNDDVEQVVAELIGA